MSADRLLFVTARLDVGGTERHLTRLLPGLVERGFDVHLHVLERGGALEEPLLAAGVAIEGPRGGSRLSRLGTAFGQLRLRLQRLEPQVVHLLLPEPSLVGALACTTRPGQRFVLGRRSLAAYRTRYPGLGAIERRIARRAVALLGNSRAVVDELVADCADPRKVGLIHNGVEPRPAPEPQARAALRAELGLAPGAPLIGVVANLIPYKGHLDLIAGLAGIARDLPAGWRAMFIGRDDGHGAALDAAARAAGVGANVLRLGLKDDARALLAMADVAVLPSHQEGFSNALIEGLVAGVPSIATDVGGNRDAIEHGVSGLLVPVRDPAALGAAIRTLAGDPARAAALGAAGRERALTRFGEPAMIDRYARLYRGLDALPGATVQSLIDG